MLIRGFIGLPLTNFVRVMFHLEDGGASGILDGSGSVKAGQKTAHGRDLHFRPFTLACALTRGLLSAPINDAVSNRRPPQRPA